jgi:hypothetical protein
MKEVVGLESDQFHHLLTISILTKYQRFSITQIINNKSVLSMKLIQSGFNRLFAEINNSNYSSNFSHNPSEK